MFTRKLYSLGQFGHVGGVWLEAHLAELVTEWVGDAPAHIDNLFLVAIRSRINFDYVNLVHLLNDVIELGEFDVIELETLSRALSNSSHIVMYFSFFASARYQLNVAA